MAEIAAKLRAQGCDVRFAIHPVALTLTLTLTLTLGASGERGGHDKRRSP